MGEIRLGDQYGAGLALTAMVGRSGRKEQGQLGCTNGKKVTG
jgi:hypothetical protein